MDSIVVPVASQEWARCAVADLLAEGLAAQVLGPGPGGAWLVRIEGPPGTIAELRYELNLPHARVCWETFVNEAVTGS